MRPITIKSKDMQDCIGKLANNVRAENINYQNYLDLYSGEENIRNINNINNTIIYGRRGSGKTHLLRALQEKINTSYADDRHFATYVDLRRIIPILPTDHTQSEAKAILIFKYIIQDLSHQILLNIDSFFSLNPFDSKFDLVRNQKYQNIITLFRKIYLEFDGDKFSKPSILTVSEEEINSISASANISAKPSITAGSTGQVKKQSRKLKQPTYQF